MKVSWSRFGVDREGVDLGRVLAVVVAGGLILFGARVLWNISVVTVQQRLANLEKFANDAAPVVGAVMQLAQQAKQQQEQQQRMVQAPQRNVMAPVVAPEKPEEPKPVEG